MLVIRGGPNLILAQPQVSAPDLWLATERAEPLPYRVQSGLLVAVHCTWACTRFMFDLTSHELLGLFSYDFQIGYPSSRSMGSPSFESPMFYCEFYLSALFDFLFFTVSELTISAR